jgi:hypothetical protein
MAEILHKEEVLNLIRREDEHEKDKSKVKTVYDAEGNEKRKDNGKEKGKTREGEEVKLKPGKGYKTNSQANPYAVRFVNAERAKAGLPQDVREEMANIEEKGVRRDLKDLKGSNIKSDIDSYLDTQTFSRRVVTENWANRVAKELVDWINAPRERDESGNVKDPIKLNEFFREKGIFHRDFYRLAQKYEVLQFAIEYAKYALGDIRERNVLEGKWNANAGMFMMGQYDPIWKQELERREAAKLKQAEAAGVDFKAIVADMMSPVAPTEEVRLKKEADGKRIEVK